MPERCPLCERPAESTTGLCAYHEASLKNLEDAYSTWNKAYDGELTRDEYYARLLARPETGQTIKNLINHFHAKGASE